MLIRSLSSNNSSVKKHFALSISTWAIFVEDVALHSANIACNISFTFAKPHIECKCISRISNSKKNCNSGKKYCSLSVRNTGFENLNESITNLLKNPAAMLSIIAICFEEKCSYLDTSWDEWRLGGNILSRFYVSHKTKKECACFPSLFWRSHRHFKLDSRHDVDMNGPAPSSEIE